MDAVWQSMVELLPAVPITLWVTGVSAVLATLLALGAGALRLSPNRAVRALSGSYIEVFRGTSALVQIFWFFFVLPLFGLSLTPNQAGVAALSLNIGAYGAEVVRGSILAVPRIQWEGAIALNMTAWQRLRRVVIPQALPLMIPQAGNLAVALLKATSLLSLVTIVEMTSRAQAIRERTGDEAAVYGALLILYFILSLGVGGVASAFERRATRHLPHLRRERKPAAMEVPA